MSANSWAVVAGILCVTLAFGIKILPISANTTIFLEVIDGALYGYGSVRGHGVLRRNWAVADCDTNREVPPVQWALGIKAFGVRE